MKWIILQFFFENFSLASRLNIRQGFGHPNSKRSLNLHHWLKVGQFFKLLGVANGFFLPSSGVRTSWIWYQQVTCEDAKTICHTLFNLLYV